MKFGKVLKENNIQFIEEEYDNNIYLYKIKGIINLVYMEGEVNIFSLDRDLFYYLNNQNEIYGFVFYANDNDATYFLKFKNKNNWLSRCFESSNKDSLYFGKEILNNKKDCKNIISDIEHSIKIRSSRLTKR